MADSCFWLLRHLERVESTARMLQVNLALLLDIDLPEIERWRPVLIVAGEEPRFVELVGDEHAADAERVQDHLVWDERNLVSILGSLRWARENARTIRETISLEMWETLNAFWLWLSGKDARKLYVRDRQGFYTRLKESCHLFHGVWSATMMEGEPFDFMRLGMWLERAGQSARILDVKHHTLGPSLGSRETPVEQVQWLSILRSLSASEPFLKRNVGLLTGPAVAGFLILDASFPRAVRCCLDHSCAAMARIRPGESSDVGKRSSAQLELLRDHVRNLTIEHVLQAGLHEELTSIIDWTAEICAAVHADFFDPRIQQIPSAEAR